MPLIKTVFKPGVNRENTRYTTEGGWYDVNRVRFRQGTPEQIGGWSRISANTFAGVCRSLWNWITLTALNLMGVGTNRKFYIELGGAYNDITPVRATNTLTNPFTATDGSSTITVAHTGHGAATGDYVTFIGGGITGLGGNITASVLRNEFQVTVLTANSYTITVGATANATDAAGSPGGGTVIAQYQVNGGEATAVPLTGWGSGGWGVSSWGGNGPTPANPLAPTLRVWNQQNFGEDLVYGPNGGPLYYWDATKGVASSTVTITIATPGVVTFGFAPTNDMAVSFTTTGALPTGLSVGTYYYVVNAAGFTGQLSLTPGGAAIATSGTQSGAHTLAVRGVPLSSMPGASNTPLFVNYLLISDQSRFLFAFGTNELGATSIDPMLIRWSDQEDAANWTPAITNQAGFIRLSNGSKIVTAIQTRQEVVVFTDSSIYSLQYVGPPYVWTSQPLSSNISIISDRAASLASGVVYWMGLDKFYRYDGRVQTLRCDLRQFIYGDINLSQVNQIFSGTNEGFNEVWWFYCSSNSSTVDRYAVYNYAEDIWYYGNLARTAWIDSALRANPHAASYSSNLVAHETGTDDNETGTPVGMNSYITSAEFDIGDGHNVGYVWRILPDMTFRGSSNVAPTATFTLYTLKNSGSGYTSPGSQGGVDNANVVRTAQVPIEQFTGQIYTRVRGRQMSLKVGANQVGTTWQLGAPRLDIRPDGRK